MTQISKTLHIIWLGSQLLPLHINRILEWKKLNPNYKLIVWTSPQFESEINNQFTQQENVIIKSIDSLHLSENINELVKRLTNKREDGLAPNYASGSDIYRWIILNIWGGWYADTDVKPIILDEITINKGLNFYFHATRNGDEIEELSPMIIASSADNSFLQYASDLIEKMSVLLLEQHIALIRNELASTRLVSTFESTGIILRAILSKVLINGQTLINAKGSLVGNKISNAELFDSLTSDFNHFNEKSWIIECTSSEDATTKKFISLSPIDGVTLDDDYIDIMYLNKPFSSLSFIAKPFLEIRTLLNNVPVRSISIIGEKIPKKHTGDVHNHLNGSFSLEFLKRTAEKNGCLEVYEELVRIKKNYLQQTQLQPENGFSKELIGLIWKQFGLIHQIIKKLDDISNGVIDVVQSSTAKYLEIRTTPKAMDNKTEDDYIDAFESGLLQVRQTISNKKAVGLLSLDRTMHTLNDAKYFINRVLKSPNKLLVGLDISGNPLAKRTLTGSELGEVISWALNAGIPMAIHMGESDTDVEKQDTDIILSALEQWKALQSPQNTNPLHGKVRLGHCIFLTPKQKEKIAELEIPIEVCPSCHKKLNWHLESSPHPVTTIYNDLSDPIVLGTDDELIFGASAKIEFNSLLSFFSNTRDLNRKEIKEHQAKFRFSI